MGLLGDTFDDIEDLDGLLGRIDTPADTRSRGQIRPSPHPRNRRAGQRKVERFINDRIAKGHKARLEASARLRKARFESGVQKGAALPPAAAVGVPRAAFRRALSPAAPAPPPSPAAGAVGRRMFAQTMHGPFDADKVQTPVPDPNDPNAAPAPADQQDYFGVPAGGAPLNFAWVSQDIFASVPDDQVWHFKGERLRMRFAWPAIDMSPVLEWPAYDEYGAVDPSNRSFDNSSRYGSDSFAVAFDLDNLRWNEHQPYGRALDEAVVRLINCVIGGGALSSAAAGPKGRISYANLNLRWEPKDMSYAGAGAAQAQPPFPWGYASKWEQMTMLRADFWRADMSGGDPLWFDPYRPMPLDLVNWYGLHVFSTKNGGQGLAPDEWQGAPADFWAVLIANCGDVGFEGKIAGADQPYPRAKSGWANIDIYHAGRMLLTVWEPDDVAANLIHGGALPANVPGISSTLPKGPPPSPEPPPGPAPPDAGVPPDSGLAPDAGGGMLPGPDVVGPGELPPELPPEGWAPGAVEAPLMAEGPGGGIPAADFSDLDPSDAGDFPTPEEGGGGLEEPADVETSDFDTSNAGADGWGQSW